MSNLRAIVILLLLLGAAVAANVMLSCRPPVPEGKRVARALVDPSAEVGWLELVRSGGGAMRLERGETGWRMVAPYSARVDDSVVLRFVDVLSQTRVSDSLSKDEIEGLGLTSVDFGLDSPRLRLAVGGASETNVYFFGRLTPTSNEVYVASGSEDRVMTLPAEGFPGIDVTVEMFRDRRILPTDVENVESIEILRPTKKPFVLVRTDDGWSTDGRMVSPQSVQSLLQRFASASADGFVWPVGATNESVAVSASMLSGYGLDGENAVICIFKVGGEDPQRVLLGSIADNRVYALVQNGGAIVTVDSSLLDSVLEDANLMANPRLFPYEASSVNVFTVSAGGINCIVAREEGGRWRLDAPVSAPADGEVAERFLERILALSPGDSEADGVKVGVNTNQELSAVRPASVLGEDRLESLRSAELVRIDPSLVRRLVASRGTNSVSVVYAPDRRLWQTENAGLSAKADEDSVQQILAALNPLKALRVEALQVPPERLPEYGLEKPAFTLAVDQSREGAVRRNILVGDRTEGGYFVTVGSTDAIFVIPESVCEVLKSSLVEE